MATPAPEACDHRRRSANGCLCCGSMDLRRETQVISGFLAARAWSGPPETTQLVSCAACGLRFFERGLSEAEALRYYRNYRDTDYVRARRQWEPFYTSRQHAAQLAWSNSPLRLDALRAALEAAKAPQRFSCALDHGGDQGQMLNAITADRKAVYEPSSCATLPGMERLADVAMFPGMWDLVLSCQVLEHVSSPQAYLREIRSLLADTGWLYIEVPIESWRPAPGNEALRAACLGHLLRWRPLLMAADLLCTISRIKLGRLPPLGFIAMREHHNYFTADALGAILCRSGFAIDACGINRAGQLFAVARKIATTDDGQNKTAAAIT